MSKNKFPINDYTKNENDFRCERLSGWERQYLDNVRFL